MSNVSASAIKSFVVLGTDGAIDVDQSVAKFQASLTTYMEASAVDGGEIGNAVTEFFAKQSPGQHVTGLDGFILGAMSPTPDNVKFIQEGIKTYLKANTGEYGESVLGMRKGIGGGHWLWAGKAKDSKEVVNSLKAIKERNDAAAKAAKTSE